MLMICSLTLVYSQTSANLKQISQTGVFTSMAEVHSDKLDPSNVATPQSPNTEKQEYMPITEPVIDAPKDGTRATRTASVSGYWSSTTTWGGASVPVDGDAVTINAGITVTVDVNAQCSSLTFTGGVSNTVSISGTNSLTVSGLVSMQLPTNLNYCTLNVNAGTCTFGSLTMLGVASATRADIINITTGSLSVAGAITTGTLGCRFIISGTGTLDLNGTRNNTPTITTVAGSTVKFGTGTLTTTALSAMTLNAASNLYYSGAAAQTILATTYACNLGLSGAGTKTIAAQALVTVNGSFTNSSNLVMALGISGTTTRLYVAGNITNNAGAIIDGTAGYATVYLNGTTPQIFTNNGTVSLTAATSAFTLANTSTGLTLLGSNQLNVIRVNLFYGTITNSNRITLGIGGTSSGVVQIAANGTSYSRGYFDQYPTFNLGTGGIQTIYTNASANYNTSYEIPADGSVAYFYMVTTNKTLTLMQNVTIPYVYATGLNLASGTLNLNGNTLTIEGTVAATGTLTGGLTSNIAYTGAVGTLLPAVSGGLNNLTINNAAGITMTGAVTVNGTLALTNGILNNGAFLTIASGSTISPSAGSISNAPTFAGTVNLLYTGTSPITAGKELPTGSSVLNNLTTNSGSFTQYAANISTVNLLTEAFPSLTAWTGDKAASVTNLMFAPSATVLAGGTSPEVRFYSTEVTHSNVEKAIYRGPISTIGKTAVNISFNTYATGNYIQDYPTYIKLQSSTSTSGPWDDVWSSLYTAHAASLVSVPLYTTNVGANLYLRFAFVGDPYALDYWDFDNLIVDGVTVTPLTSNLTVNGTLNLVGNYTVGSGNSITMADNATINRSNGELSAAPAFGNNINLIYSGTSPITTGFENKAAGNNNVSLNNSAGVTLGSDMKVNGALNFASGSLALDSNKLTLAGKNFSISGVNSLSALSVSQSATPQTIGTEQGIAGTWNITGVSDGPLSMNLSWPTGSDNGCTFDGGFGAVMRFNGTSWDCIATGSVSTVSNNRYLAFAGTLSAKASAGDLTIKSLVSPDVTTQAVTDITATSAIGNGTIESAGTPANVTEHGICWATSENPTTDDAHTSEGIGTVGAFTSSITALEAGTLYYVRAYAKNDNGTAYGDQVSFTTISGYDYSESVPVELSPRTIIVLTQGNANIGTGEIPLFLDGTFTPTESYVLNLIGSGPWTISFTTEAMWGACYKSGAWLTIQNTGGEIVFENITASKDIELPILLGDAESTLPVELSSFTAVLSNRNYVNISWVTQSETNLTGFYVYRADSDDVDNALLISTMINPTNTSQQQQYLFTDKNIAGPGMYYYWLQVTEMDGSNDYHGPISFSYMDVNSLNNPDIPLVTQLTTIYPNPFNPTTTIGYGIAKLANVNITIYNSRGQLIMTFCEGLKTPNNYKLNWNGKDYNGRECSTGIYYIKMQVGKESYTRKAVLMK